MKQPAIAMATEESHLLITEQSVRSHVVLCVRARSVEAQREDEPPFMRTVLNLNAVV